MANLVITSDEESVIITANSYAPIVGYDVLTVDKDYLSLTLNSSNSPTWIEIFQYPGDQKHYATWDPASTFPDPGQYPIVDSVNGVAPSSEADLYHMLRELNSFTPLAYDSSALEASAVVYAGGACLFNLSGYNSGPDQFIQVHNTTSVPANGAVPVIVLKAKTGDNFYWQSGNYAKDFPTGIVVCNSTTAATKTLGASDCWFNAQYKIS